MKQIRQIHLYLGSLFAPMILFFAFSGALQTFGLHESDDGEPAPAGWIVNIASVHKDQHLPRPHKHAHAEEHAAPTPAPAAVANTEPGKAEDDHANEGGASKPAHSPLPLKIFVLALSIGLMASTLLGVYIALQNRNQRKIVIGMLAVGVFLPIVLLIF